MADLIKFKRGTTAQWASLNPVLVAGEPGVDLDTGEVRVGDGVTAWADLPSTGTADGVTAEEVDEQIIEAISNWSVTPTGEMVATNVQDALEDLYDLAGPESELTLLRNRWIILDDFHPPTPRVVGADTLVGDLDWLVTLVSGGQVLPSSAITGMVSLQATNVGDAATIGLPFVSNGYFAWVMEFRLGLDGGSPAVNHQRLRFGLMDAASPSANDHSIYFEIQNNSTYHAIKTVTKAAGVATETVITDPAVSALSTRRYGIFSDGSGTGITFTINDQPVATHATNIPSIFTPCTPRVTLEKLVGSTMKSSSIDYFVMRGSR